MDDATVRFVLKEPRASFLAVLTAGAASIVSPTAAMKAGLDYAVSPVGTGPVQVRVLGPRPARGAREEPDLLALPGQGGPRRSSGRSPRTRRGSPSCSPAPLDLIVGTPPDFVAQLENHPKVTLQRAGGRARLVPRLQQHEEALRRQARAPGAELRGQQGRHRPRRARRAPAPSPRARCCPAPGATRAGSSLPLRPGARQEAPRRGRLAERLLHHAAGCPSRARACSRRWR